MMGKLSVFKIALSNVHGVYFAGQMLQGHVILELNEPVKLKGIRITFRGRAFVHWTEQLMRGPGESRFREIRHHAAKEEYFDVSHPLIPRGSGNNDEKRILAPGQYTYPFQFELPANLPSSFEGQHGYLRYWIKVTMEKPWKNDYSTKKVFTVLCPMDLNREPSSGVASPSVKKNKRLCCLCCRSGPVSAVLSVQQKGFVPGEAIVITGEVNNMSSRKMGGSSVELKMTTVFHSTTKSRAITQQVGKLKRGPISCGDTDIWDGEKLIIPPLPPSFLLGCSIIDIKYIIELRVDPVGPAFDLSIPIEILIGTIPVRSAVQNYIRNNQIAPPVDRPPQPPPSCPNNNIGWTNSVLTNTYGQPSQSPSSPGYSVSQPSTPGIAFSYGQPGYSFPPSSAHNKLSHHGQFQGQNYGQSQAQGFGQDQNNVQGYGQGQGYNYGPPPVPGHGYGQSQAQGFGQDQNSVQGYGQGQGYNYGPPPVPGHGYGQSRPYPHPQGQQVNQLYPHAADARLSNGPHPQGASADAQGDNMWMPTPMLSEYFFGQRYVRDDDDDEYTQGDLYYTPLYVLYDFEKPKEKPTRTVRIAS
ncbi:arrestin domain-containing protein 3-like [Haliotis rubra]|uniref:arrestin domain-containing protein 3-like n=1 Tax=Haliotis rubra TaxID=36100 RepID=UPI001EE5EBD6|nr:arrestin domain-containing protein 3-like [Haliotis rubra]